MKFIFDFDDTLFDSKRFKERIYACLEKASISRSTAETHYRAVRLTQEPFSLKKFLTDLLPSPSEVEVVYLDIMRVCQSFINQELLAVIRRLGRDNCYIVTQGDEEFQNDKIEKSAISMLFAERHIVTGPKRELVSQICARYKDEDVVFVDNKVDALNDIDREKCQNLKTILWDEHGLAKLSTLTKGDAGNELRRRK